MTFAEFLENHISEKRISFHMPGHKGREIFDIHGMRDMLNDLVSGDITEIPGADNLSQPEGIIRDVMDRYKHLYGSAETYISLGGSTLGLIASILSLCEISKGNEETRRPAIGIARNSHQSVFNGVTLAGVESVYIYPEILESGFVGEINPGAVESAFERAEAENLELVAVVIPNPNYYGVCSDMPKIAEITHRNGAYLLVDQAHGAHLRFMFPKLSSDISGDCDIVVESTHKTLATFTQTAIVNIYNTDLIDIFERKLKMVQSTSPSYILMKSLDMNAELIEHYGKDLFESWRMNLNRTYEALDELNIEYFMNQRHDRTKILIDMSSMGLSGRALNQELFNRNIICELDSGNYAMCMTGIGNSKIDYDRLIDALSEIRKSETVTESLSDGIEKEKEQEFFSLMNKSRPRGSVTADCEWMKIGDAVGMISAQNIVPYPPGVPLIAAGETMDEESLIWIDNFNQSGGKVLGISPKGMVMAVKNEN